MSKQIAISAAAAVTLALSMAAQTFAGQSYTREEAVKIAMENSSDIKTAEDDLKSASSKVESGYGNAYPSVDLNATVTRIFGLDDVNPKNTKILDAMYGTKQQYGLPDDPSAYDMVAAGALDGLINGMAAQGYRWQSSIDLTVTQILYAQGKVGTGIEIAKTYKHLQEVNLENTKANVRYDVEKAFNQVIVLDSTEAILKASIEMTQTALDLATQSFQSGMGKELDVVRAQLELSKLQSDMENLQKGKVLARNALLNTMGLPADAEVTFVGELKDPSAGATYPDTSMANVKKRRKELLMLEESEKMLSKNVNIEEGGYKPTVVLGGQIGYSNKQNEFYKWDAPDWDKNITKAVFLNVSMNLFNGMKTKESVAQAKINLHSTQIQKETAERGFRLQIESCANELSNAEHQIELKKQSVELAQKNYDMTEAAYKVGKAPQVDLLSANLSLRVAKNDLLNAILSWNNAYNALLQATGEY